MLLTIEALRTQLHEQQRLGRERVAALVEDRRLRMAEVRQMHRVNELGVASLAFLSCDSTCVFLSLTFSRMPGGGGVWRRSGVEGVDGKVEVLG